MAYPMNIFLVLAKSLMDTPEIIMATRQKEHLERKAEFAAIEKSLNDPSHPKMQMLGNLLEDMRKEYRVYGHYEDTDPPPLPQDVAGGLNLATTRLIIVAHGNPATPDYVLLDKGDPEAPTGRISAQLLARRVRMFLNEKSVERISLHICSAAKQHAPPPDSNKSAQSFALNFARYAGKLARSVSARTGSVTTDKVTGNRVTSATEHGIHKYRQSFDKVIFSTGEDAAARAPDYGQKERRDLLLKTLIAQNNEQALKDIVSNQIKKAQAQGLE